MYNHGKRVFFRIFIVMMIFILIFIIPVSASSSASNTDVTVSVAGAQSYYLGKEMIKLSGTNTVTNKTYLFLINNQLPSSGGSIKAADPRLDTNKVVTGDDQNFQVVDVRGDNTWSWTWDTSNVALEAGTFTIYAVSAPKNKNDLSDAAYGTAVIMIKTEKPTVSATISQPTIMKGNSLLITGIATGNPSNGVAIWIIGPGVSSSKQNAGNINYLNRVTVQPDSTGKFSYEIDSSVTAIMGSGTGYIIAQHPMYNNAFDILLVNGRLGKIPSINFSDNYNSRHAYPGPDSYLGYVHIPYSMGGVIGADVEDVLTEALKDPNVDDSYAEIQFSVVEPATTTTSVPTTVSTTAKTTTMVPTTAVTASPTTTLITTLTTTVTTAPTDSVNKLLEEQNKKIEEQNKKLEDLNKTIAEQNQKLSEQNDMLTQIINFLKSMFGWK